MASVSPTWPAVEKMSLCTEITLGESKLGYLRHTHTCKYTLCWQWQPVLYFHPSDIPLSVFSVPPLLKFPHSTPSFSLSPHFPSPLFFLFFWNHPSIPKFRKKEKHRQGKQRVRQRGRLDGNKRDTWRDSNWLLPQFKCHFQPDIFNLFSFLHVIRGKQKWNQCRRTR